MFIYFLIMPKKIQKQKPIVIIALILFAFTLVALVNAGFGRFSNISGFSVYGKLSSIFSGNTLSTIGGPLAILTVILTISISALHKVTKD